MSYYERPWQRVAFKPIERLDRWLFPDRWRYDYRKTGVPWRALRPTRCTSAVAIEIGAALALLFGFAFLIFLAVGG